MRSRLRRAREDGFLEVRGADGAEMLRVFGAWCWRLRLALVWWERNSPYSRYGQVRLDLFTTGKRLTEQGQEEMRALAPWAAEVSAHDGVWRHVPRAELPRLAARVLRAAVKAENGEPAAPRRIVAPVIRSHRGAAKVIAIERARTATA